MPIPKGQPYKFNEEKREEYLGYLRGGLLKFAAAKKAGIGYRTIQRYRAADPNFKELEGLAIMEAVGNVEQVVYDLALGGDLKAADMVLKAYNRAYSPTARVEIDATDNAVELSRNDAIARLAAAQEKLEDRRKALEENVIDVEATDT